MHWEEAHLKNMEPIFHLESTHFCASNNHHWYLHSVYLYLDHGCFERSSVQLPDLTFKTPEIWKQRKQNGATPSWAVSRERRTSASLLGVSPRQHEATPENAEGGNRANHHKRGVYLRRRDEEQSDGKGRGQRRQSQGGRIRGVRERTKMEVQPSSSHRSIVFQGKCYWKARHGGENRARCYEILHHSSWGLKGSSFGWVQL